jgi:type II secretory pathway pseudopilin PulG
MKKRNFTLLELVFVTGILAIVAGAGVYAFNGTEENAAAKVESYKSSIIYKAFLKFRKDMGYYPKIGPLNFARTENSEAEEWFDDTENMMQLFIEPVDISITDFWIWNPETKRGWGGPYLSINGAFLDIDNKYKINAGTGFVQYDPTALKLTFIDSEKNLQTLQLPQ